MKQFLVPALLLSLVGVAAAIASGSAPSPASSGAGECHKAAPGLSCPMSSGECDKVMGAEHCAEAAAKHCAEAVGKSECAEECEDAPAVEECKKKMECCPKSSEPVEKP
jgi:hypothetical protein